jgi:hypothetical protein
VTGAVLLAVAVAALGAAGLRAAAALGADGALRIVAAAPLAAGTAAVTALALGRVGLGGSAVALTLAALLAFAAARLLPPPDRLRLEIAPGAWIAAGIAAAWVAWIVKHPNLGSDPLTYHLPASIGWVQHGDTGAVRQVVFEFPVGNYPLLDETLVAWLLGIAHGFGAAILWAPAMAALAGFAGFTGLRLLGATRLVAGLGVAAVLLIPILAALYVGPHTDVGALAWLTCCGTLVAARQPRLLAPALVAAGLAIGAKTTTAPLVLAIGVLGVRPPLRPRGALLAAGAVALVVGGLWYVRDLVLHGSPFWPFIAAPWGDPVPPFLGAIDVTFFDRPWETLDGRLDDYGRILAGAPLLLLGALVAGGRGAIVVAFAVLIWSRAPFTGRADNPVFDLSITTVRYLLPACAAAVAVLAASSRRWVPALLAVVVAVNAWRALALGAPEVPGVLWLLAGAAAGLAAARLRPGAWLAAPLLVALVVAGGHHFAARHANNPNLPSSPMIAWFAAQPAWQDGEDPIASAPQVFAPLAGDRLQHRLSLLPLHPDCARLRARGGWVIVGYSALTPVRAARCFSGDTPVYENARFRVYDLRQTAITSSTSSRPSETTEKSSSVIAAAAGSSWRRARLSSPS